MFKFRGSGGDNEGIAAAIAKQFRSRKPTLMRRLQYYKENRKQLEMYSEIREIKLYLEIMKNKLMVDFRTHGVAELRTFLSKTYHMDSKHPIPTNWKPKTSVPPCRYVYDPNLDWDPAKFPSRMSRKVKYFNGPLPPSINPSGNKMYFPWIIGQQISRSRSRSRIRPALCYPQQPGFPGTSRMRPAINYDNRNRTSTTPPPRRRDSIATSAYRQQRNFDISRDFDRNRRCSTARSRDNERDRRSKSRSRQSSTLRNGGVRERLRPEASNEEFYKLGQREKKRENGADEAQKRKEKARNPAVTNAAVGKPTQNVGHWENMARELLEKGRQSRHSAAEGGYQDVPQTSRRSVLRPRAASRSVNQQQRRKQSSNNDPNWLQEDYYPRRRNRDYDRAPSQPINQDESNYNSGESHWLNAPTTLMCRNRLSSNCRIILLAR